MVRVSIPALTLVFILRGTGAQSVTQPEDQVTVSEGDPLELKCTYSYWSTPSLFWYVQYPTQGLQLILKYTSGNTLVKGIKGFEAEFNKSKTSFHLKKFSAQGSDSARYFCAVKDARGVSGEQRLFWGTGTSLIVNPTIRDPQPAVYQLKSPESSNTSVCLFTDFDSSITNTSGSNPTVLEMMSMESKSYGSVAWGDKSNFNCKIAFKPDITHNFNPPSGSTCKVQDVQQSFETDKDLNLMNMSLIFLRIIFLKTVGFNLLMTLRLWSN